MNTIESSKTLSAITGIVDLLKSNAREDSEGVYWDLQKSVPDPKQSAGAAISIGFGTTGVLLFLAEYYARTADETLVPFLERGVVWVRQRAVDAPVRHGYYFGHGGFLVALQKIENRLGRVWGQEDRRYAAQIFRRLAAEPNGVPCGLAAGLAGTLLALGTLKGEIPELAAMEAAILSELVARTRVTTKGIYWDKLPNTMKAPLGMLHGTAGIEYVLARLGLGGDQGAFAWLLKAAHAYDLSEFDHESGNWRDYVFEEHFGRAEIRDALAAAARSGDSSKFRVFGDTCDWANGTAGILAARLTMSASGLVACEDDVALATTRLGRKIDKISFLTDRFTLADGWGGIACVLASRSHSQVESFGATARAKIEELAGRQFEKLGSFRTKRGSAFDAGLLYGQAGVGYALLGLANFDPSLDVLAPAPLPAVESARFSREKCMALIASHSTQLPTVGHYGDAAVSAPEALRLPDFIDAFRPVAQSVHSRHALEFELKRLLREERQVGDNFIWYQKHARTAEYAMQWKDAGQPELDRVWFRLTPGVEVGRCAFRVDHHHPHPKPEDGSMFLLLEPGYDCLHNFVLTPFLYALYSHLRQFTTLSELKDRLKVKYPTLVGAVNAEFDETVVRHVRQGLQSGHLIASSTL